MRTKPLNRRLDGLFILRIISLVPTCVEEHLGVRLVQHEFGPFLTQPESERHPANCHCPVQAVRRQDAVLHRGQPFTYDLNCHEGSLVRLMLRYSKQIRNCARAHPAEMPTAVSPRVSSETLAQLIQVFPLPIFANDLTPILRFPKVSIKLYRSFSSCTTRPRRSPLAMT